VMRPPATPTSCWAFPNSASTADRGNHERITDDILLNAAERLGPGLSRRASMHDPHISGSSTKSADRLLPPPKIYGALNH
jgi:hypothetical protein